MTKVNEKTAPVAGAVSRGYDVCDAAEIYVAEYSKILIFRDENNFLNFLEANIHLTPIYGVRDYEKQLFPDLYIAAITAVG